MTDIPNVELLTAQRDAARHALAALHEGEAPADDDDRVTSGPLFIRRWNRATPTERLARAEQIVTDRLTAIQAPFREQRISELAEGWGNLTAERDGAYRERAQLLAWLATTHPAVIASAPDVDEDGWLILYLTADSQQLSWHISPRDVDLFDHVDRVAASDPRAQWDGHTTAEKYQRIRDAIASGEKPAVGLDAVRALHYPETAHWGGQQCYLCRDPYPCATINALNGSSDA